MNKLDFSKPEELQTRDGRQVRIYATDGGNCAPIHGAILEDGVWWSITSWTPSGAATTLHESSDLVRKPTRIKGWTNVYSGGTLATVCADRGECKKHAGWDCLGQIYIDAEIQT